MITTLSLKKHQFFRRKFAKIVIITGTPVLCRFSYLNDWYQLFKGSTVVSISKQGYIFT
jgi:hypothetical protein